ncbi:MAG TPA: hypothetical protein VMC43_02800 [Candidatus Paceibacterota bacterium]|nr:hypothetical protein [Candidatus Paceibacterota bacterium]
MKKLIHLRLSPFLRNIEGGDLIESFLVAAISTILVVRVFLELTGYPMLAHGQYHIAHLLWGGLLMMFAVFVLLVFLNKEAKQFAAVMGGIGFGLFIDEIGKFITKKNDYFFEPSIAIIYVIFILLFLGLRAFEKRFVFSPKDYAANALESSKEIILYDLDEQERARALRYLDRADQENPAVRQLYRLLYEANVITERHPNIFVRLRRKVRDKYLHLVKKSWFAKTLITLFITGSIYEVVTALRTVSAADSFADWGQIISSVLSGAFVFAGALALLRGRRLASYHLFKWAVLISIFLTQFFLFVEEQLSAVSALAVSLVILTTISQWISEEEGLIAESHRNAVA